MVIAAIILCLIASAICKAVTDTLVHHYHTSPFAKMNYKFWHPDFSWQNKYKDDLKTPKFFGSTTFLVWTTDAWHLFDMLHLTFLQLPLAVTAAFLMGSMNWALGVFAMIKLITGLVFEFFYRRWAK